MLDIVSEKPIKLALEKILASPNFKSSEQRSRFLEYVVTETLENRSDQIIGYSIAVDVYGRGVDFDAQKDPLVRLEAGKLRRELEHYYLTDGRGLALQEKPSHLAVLMFLIAVIVYPATGVVLGRPWQAAEVFGLSPDPLVATTLAVLLASKGWLSWAAWVAPLVWVALSGLTLWMLGSAEWILLPTFALLCVVLAAGPSLTRQ